MYRSAQKTIPRYRRQSELKENGSIDGIEKSPCANRPDGDGECFYLDKDKNSEVCRTCLFRGGGVYRSNAELRKVWDARPKYYCTVCGGPKKSEQSKYCLSCSKTISNRRTAWKKKYGNKEMPVGYLYETCGERKNPTV